MTTLYTGAGGDVRTLGGVRVGTLGAWEIVVSPTTQRPTLKGDGRFLRIWAGAADLAVVVTLTPTPPLARLGTPPARVRPFTLSGFLARLTPSAITIARGTIEAR